MASVEANRGRYRFVAFIKRRCWSAILFGAHRSGYPDTDKPCLRRVRYDMHFVFLSVSGVDDEKPLLYGMQDIQLGFRHDVHSLRIYTSRLYLEPAFYVAASVAAMGGRGAPISREILGVHERVPCLQKLQGKALPS